MARFQIERGPIPLHHQVFRDLDAALDAEEWRPGDRMPTERDLAARYGCSLITVRHALAELVRKGRIERTQGRGTFVLPVRIDRDFTEVRSFTREMEGHGLDPATRSVMTRAEPAEESVATALKIALGAPTLYIERLRLAGGTPLLLEQVHLPGDRFPGLLASDLEHHSLYDTLTERYATPVVRARETLQPVLLRAREARLLGELPRKPALLIEGLGFTVDDTPVEFARTFVRGDRTRYYIERVVVRLDDGSAHAAHARAESADRRAAADGGRQRRIG